MGSLISTLIGGTVADEPSADSDSPVIAVRSKDRWDKQLEANRVCAPQLMVVDFSAPWCRPCRLIAPVFEEMASAFADVAFVEINADELPEVAKAFRIKKVPTFVLVKGGREVARVLGAKKDELQTKIQHVSGPQWEEAPMDSMCCFAN